MRIKVNTSTVKSNVKNIAQCFNNLQAGLNGVNTEFEGIGAFWEGLDSANFMQAANDYISTLPKLQSSIESNMEAINGYLSKVEALDEKYASIVINLV